MDAQKKNLNRWIVFAFLFLCAAQLYFQVRMIAMQEAIATEGKLFRFKVAPVDPNDPFRGKYITLRYKADSVKVKNVNEFLRKGKAFVVLNEDVQGYAAIKAITLLEPAELSNYVEVIVRRGFNGNDTNTLYVEYPFTRFYMEETKAPMAEKMFLQNSQGPGDDTHALVYVKEGKAVIQDVILNGMSVKDVVK